MDRLARQFWIVTLDGITQPVRELYREDGIETYDHRGVELPWPDVQRTVIHGWNSLATHESIPMEVVYRLR